MITIEKKYWWAYMIIGITSIIVAVWCLFTPLNVLETLVVLFAVWFLFKSVFEIVYAVSNRAWFANWKWYLAGGVVDLIFALILVTSPLTAAFTLFMIVGIWLLFQFIMNIAVSAQMLSLKVHGALMSLIMSAVGIVIAFILILNPAVMSAFIVYMFSIALVVYGISRISIALYLKK